MMSNTWAVIPTYNERENLELLLVGLTSVFHGSILIVDDQSPDGTGDQAESLRKRWPQLSVLHRQEKTGLASAYRDGLHHALAQGAEFVVHMDADRSHDPNRVPGMLAMLGEADLTVGSRYVAGGTINIPMHRRLISLIGNAYIQLLLGNDVHDWSSGFCAWKRDTLQAALQEATTTVGYAWLIEMKWRAKQHGATMQELPVQFIDRQAGESKFSWAIMLEDLRTAWRLRFKR